MRLNKHVGSRTELDWSCRDEDVGQLGRHDDVDDWLDSVVHQAPG